MKDIIILDGGMGTELQARGLAPGERPELFGIDHPEGGAGNSSELHRRGQPRYLQQYVRSERA